jgi:acylglycerol lipase
MTANTSTPVKEEYLDGKDGLRIFARSWRPASVPRAVVAICHGVNSHSGQYFWAAEQLASDGYAVYALDLRGRGKSDGERFFVDDVADYVDDLSRLIGLAKQREPGLPIFLLGHSAGGVVSSVYTLENQEELAGFICESFAFQVPAPDFALAVIKGLSHLAPHAHVLRLKNEDFSRDSAIVASMNSDPLIKNEVQPTRTVAALVRADERLKREFPLITLPVFIMHGTADKATRPSGSQLFFDTAGSSDKTLKLYPGHFHDLLNDVGREDVMADILDWIRVRLPVETTLAAAS